MDDKTKTGKADDSRINIHERYEVKYWTRMLNVSEADLVIAVKPVGPMVKDVAKFFRPSRS